VFRYGRWFRTEWRTERIEGVVNDRFPEILEAHGSPIFNLYPVQASTCMGILKSSSLSCCLSPLFGMFAG
jgi:hypothetical protein